MASRPAADHRLPARIGRALVRSSTKLRLWGEGVADVPALLNAERALALTATRKVPKRSLRIPDEAIVPIQAGAAALPAPPKPLLLPGPTPSANDNLPDEGSAAQRRKLLRDLVFLVILFATVAGAFYSGRLHAKQNVIVVPEPAIWRGVLSMATG